MTKCLLYDMNRNDLYFLNLQCIVVISVSVCSFLFQLVVLKCRVMIHVVELVIA